MIAKFSKTRPRGMPRAAGGATPSFLIPLTSLLKSSAAGGATPSFLIPLSSLVKSSVAGGVSPSFLIPLSSLLNRTSKIASAAPLSFLTPLSSLLAILALAACAGRPVPMPAPPPTAVPAPAPAAFAKPTATETPETFPPAPAPSPSPAPPPSAASSPAWETLDALGAMSQITIGQHAICGLRSQNAEGNAVCVGWDNVRWGGGGSFAAIESGREYQCGLRIDREIVCRGLNIYGETDPPEGEFHALSAGKRHACALDAAGKAVCWGWNKDGRAAPPPDAIFAAIAAGHAHSCGIAEFGNLVCWGTDSHGESEPREGPFAALALGNNHTCALRPSGQAFCQGDDSHGQASPPAEASFAQISAGDRQTCGIPRDGGIECWGASPVSKRSGEYVSASVGYSRTCAHRADGYAECWSYAAAVESPEGEVLQGELPILGGAEFHQPVEMFPWPFGGLAVVERRGYVEIHSDAKSGPRAEPRVALDFFDRVYCCQTERGMLSAVLDPDFENFPFIYIYYQIDAQDQTLGVDSFFGRVSRFPVRDDERGGRVIADDELVILELAQSGTYMGGALRFGQDGMLYASLGKDADCAAEKSARRECMGAQDLRTLSGKIIRIDVRGATEAQPYRVPPDNPFVDRPNARPEIWAYGLRNPYRMGFNREGDLIVADVGAVYFEELSIADAGANLGWPRFEANLCRSLDAALCAEVTNYAMPIYVYDHWRGNCAIIGGANLPGPAGEYVFGDFCSGRVWALEGDAQTGYSARELADFPRAITGFGTDADGEIYALTQDGPIVQIVP